MPNANNPTWPSDNIVAVVPSDSTNFNDIVRQLYVGVGGDVTVVTINNQVITLKEGMQPIQFNGPLLLLGSTVITNDTSTAPVSLPASAQVIKDTLPKALVVKDTTKIKKLKKVDIVKKAPLKKAVIPVKKNVKVPTKKIKVNLS